MFHDLDELTVREKNIKAAFYVTISQALRGSRHMPF